MAGPCHGHVSSWQRPLSRTMDAPRICTHRGSAACMFTECLMASRHQRAGGLGQCPGEADGLATRGALPPRAGSPTSRGLLHTPSRRSMAAALCLPLPSAPPSAASGAVSGGGPHSSLPTWASGSLGRSKQMSTCWAVPSGQEGRALIHHVGQ